MMKTKLAYLKFQSKKLFCTQTMCWFTPGNRLTRDCAAPSTFKFCLEATYGFESKPSNFLKSFRFLPSPREWLASCKFSKDFPMIKVWLDFRFYVQFLDFLEVTFHCLSWLKNLVVLWVNEVKEPDQNFYEKLPEHTFHTCDWFTSTIENWPT